MINKLGQAFNSERQGIGMTSQRTRNRLVESLVKMGVKSEVVLSIIGNTPRHLFIEEALNSRAYENTALPIGYKQTISQPYIIARMIEILLADGVNNKVLEIGTGCGYQTAVLSQCVKMVYTIERIAPLLFQARERLHDLKYHNVKSKHADGNIGWEEYAPYDGIIVAAASPKVPDMLLEQLAVNGRLIIPIGSSKQQLLCVNKTKDGYTEEVIEDVVFVPMLSGVVNH